MDDYSTLLAESAIIRRVLNYAFRQFHNTSWNEELEIMWQEGPQKYSTFSIFGLEKKKKEKNIFQRMVCVQFEIRKRKTFGLQWSNECYQAGTSWCSVVKIFGT
jgi:hypothetical protein